MNPNWRQILVQALLGISVAVILLFASTNTSRLHDSERKMHAGAIREPQAADPAEAFIEIVLESSPLAQLSSGFTGIAPSMHLVRLSSTRPLSNVDGIEHAARRRFGRIDFSFAFLVVLPIALIPMYFFIYRKCADRGDAEKLISGRTKLFDFCVERILLPLLATGGFVAIITLVCLYSTGIRLGSNELLGLIFLWAVTISIYLLGWMLLFTLLLLRSKLFASAIIQYAAIFLLLVFIVPQFLQTIALSIERPRGRLPLVVERRMMSQKTVPDDRPAIDRFLVRNGFAPLNGAELLTKPQSLALVNLRIEEAVSPKLQEFETTVARLDSLALAGSWLSPYLVAQYAVDEIAGTGLARYSAFRTASIQFHERWRKYMLGFVSSRKYMDFDALNGAPKFQFPISEPAVIFSQVLPRLGFLLAACLGLTLIIRVELKKLLPGRRKTAR